jgi:hypothetical protein
MWERQTALLDRCIRDGGHADAAGRDAAVIFDQLGGRNRAPKVSK